MEISLVLSLKYIAAYSKSSNMCISLYSMSTRNASSVLFHPRVASFGVFGKNMLV